MRPDIVGEPVDDFPGRRHCRQGGWRHLHCAAAAGDLHHVIDGECLRGEQHRCGAVRRTGRSGRARELFGNCHRFI